MPPQSAGTDNSSRLYLPDVKQSPQVKTKKDDPMNVKIIAKNPADNVRLPELPK